MRVYCLKCGQRFEQAPRLLGTKDTYHCPRCVRAMALSQRPIDTDPLAQAVDLLNALGTFDSPASTPDPIPDPIPDPPPFEFGGGGGFDGGGAGRDF